MTKGVEKIVINCAIALFLCSLPSSLTYVVKGGFSDELIASIFWGKLFIYTMAVGVVPFLLNKLIDTINSKKEAKH